MTYRKFFQTCAAAAFACAAVLPLTASAAGTPGQEVVSSFNTAVFGASGRLVQGPDGAYWGTSYLGGTSDGALIRVQPDGSWDIPYYFQNSKEHLGRYPSGTLWNDGHGNLWGAATRGGSADGDGYGVLFKYEVATGAYTVIHNFNTQNSDTSARYPNGAPVPDGKGYLWGVCSSSLPSAAGMIYKLNLDSLEFSVVAQFTGQTTGDLRGTQIAGNLAGNGGKYLWGACSFGGSQGLGTVFRVDTDSGQVTTLLDFPDASDNRGGIPSGPLKWDGLGYFWGTTNQASGNQSQGTVFKVNATTGTLTTVAVFPGGEFNSNGPIGDLELDGSGVLWGSSASFIYKVDPKTRILTTIRGIDQAVGTVPLFYDGHGSMIAAAKSVYKIDTTSGQTSILSPIIENGSSIHGLSPYAGLTTDSHGVAWGSAQFGGVGGYGSLFTVDLLTGKRQLVLDFTGPTGAVPGKSPRPELVPDSHGFLWGAADGGQSERGVLFKIDEVTHVYTKVVDFKDVNGALPGPLTFDASGTGWVATQGDSSSGASATIFRLDPVTGTLTEAYRSPSEEAALFAPCALYDDGQGYLWGSCLWTSTAPYGSIFKFSKATSQLTTVLRFTGTDGQFVGAHPNAKLLPDGEGYLWGTSSGLLYTTATGQGSVFKIRIADGQFTLVNAFPNLTNSGFPRGGLIFDNQGRLWGVTSGRYSDPGSLYSVDPQTNALTPQGTLGAAGINPGSGGLLSYSDGNLYATTTAGGVTNNGTITRFRMGSTPVTQPVQGFGGSYAHLYGKVLFNGYSANVYFQYSLSPDFSDAKTQAPITYTFGTDFRNYAGLLFNLQRNTTYYYRIVAENPEVPNTQYGATLSFTTLDDNANLASLSVGGGTLAPAFNAAVTDYHVTVPSTLSSAIIAATAVDPRSRVTIDSTIAGSATVPLVDGPNSIAITVSSSDASVSKTYNLTIDRLPSKFGLSSQTEPALTLGSLTATGLNAGFQLNFRPDPAQPLTVAKITGLDFIHGTFANLAQGQQVDLTYDGVVYHYVVNYYGGSGNDLVLTPANARVETWGYNGYGQLGRDTSNQDSAGPAYASGVPELTGRIPLSIYAGQYASYAICSDGAVVSWGRQDMVGFNSTQNGKSGLLDTSGVLAGKTVVALSGGFEHTLALCSDGTLAAWGDNGFAQLGDAHNPTDSRVPVAVKMTGALAGKTVVAITSGTRYNIVLCSDGTLAGWGVNTFGQLGNGSTVGANEPAIISPTGALVGRSVVAISSGRDFTLALCSDGSLVSWGMGGEGELGNGVMGNSSTPVLVDRTGVLAGKTITAISAGGYHAAVLCSDGSIASWGEATEGQLGAGGRNVTNTATPILAATGTGTGLGTLLAGKTIASLNTGLYHTIVTCTDGSAASWGFNLNGQLGYPTPSQTPVPLTVNPPAYQRFKAISTGPNSASNLGLVSNYPITSVTAGAVTARTSSSFVLNGTVNAGGPDPVAVYFEYSTSSSYYDHAVAATPATASGTTDVLVSLALTGLPQQTGYYYRIVAYGPGGTFATPQQFTGTQSNNPNLSNMTVNSGKLSPVFSPLTTSYTLTLPYGTSSLQVVAGTASGQAKASISGQAGSSYAVATLTLPVGTTTVPIVVTAEDPSFTKSYSIAVTRLPQDLTLTSAEASLKAAQLTASGALNLQLGFKPAVGVPLKLIDMTGLDAMSGRFTNLAHGQDLSLVYNGVTYRYVVNYYGGSGNDLVLEWKKVQLVSWGSNAYYALGQGLSSQDDTLGPVSGILEGKTPLVAYSGYANAIVACSDGTLAFWGRSRVVPAFPEEDPSVMSTPHALSPGALAGKTVIGLAGGSAHFVALTSDGTLATWGSNGYGQLGVDLIASSATPVALKKTNALAPDRIPVAVAAGSRFTEVLCSDGVVVGWGDGSTGQLGNGQNAVTNVPFTITLDGVLNGRKVVAIACSNDNTLALCSDGGLVAWGQNTYGECGKTPGTIVPVPVVVPFTGALAGKTVVAISGGGSHFMALCSDGTIAGWGDNSYGNLGNGQRTDTPVVTPVAVDLTGALTGKTVTAIRGFAHGSLALCSDGNVYFWGASISGQANVPLSATPALVPKAAGLQSFPYIKLAGSPGSDTPFGLVALPDAPTVLTGSASQKGHEVTFTGTANAQGNGDVAISFQYGVDSSYGGSSGATPQGISGSADTAVKTTVINLIPNTVYHYRVVATFSGQTVYGEEKTFRTLNDEASLASLTLDAGVLVPGFDPAVLVYRATVANASNRLTVGVAAVDQKAQVTVGVNGSTYSGLGSAELQLSVGNNGVPILVTAEDGVTTKIYELHVVRLPESFNLTGPLDQPLMEVDGFDAGGFSVPLGLNFAPAPGISLMLVKNTALSWIDGRFTNLAQGQIVTLDYQGVRYRFVVNYYGGSGNDLVLEWADTRLAAWGANSYGQTGTGAADKLPVTTPALVGGNGALAGKTVLRTSSGYLHSLALCSDGTVTAWGYNVYGQLGDGTTTQRNEPVQVNATGALAGKTVVAIAAGAFHNLALCSDGTLAAWGYNNSGQLGDGTKVSSSAPTAVAQTGALAGKTVVGIAAGAYQSYALCSDGTVVGWGYDGEGELGDGGTAVAVTTPVQAGGELAGRKVTALAAGQYHVLALTDNASIIAWGFNKEGQVRGTGSVSVAPVEILPSGVMDGEEVTAIAAGGSHSLALLSNGTIAAWGANASGQLGNGTTTGTAASGEPVAVATSGALRGKTVTAVSASGTSSYALASDGTLLAWGANASGQLGSGALSTGSTTPAVVLDPSSAAAAPYVVTAGSSSASHGLGLVALPAQVLSATSTGSGALAAWRLAHFQTTDNAGSAADLADPDQDGVPNLQEYAFGLDPLSAASGPSALPHWHREGDFLVLSFTVPAGVTGVTYAAQSSATPTATGAWSFLPDTGVDGTHTFRVPLVKGQTGFVRLSVATP